VSVRALTSTERRTLAILGLPTAALALAITIVTTYVPVAVNDLVDSSIVIGGLIAIEGVLALWLPLVVGSWSDRLKTSVGGRLPFLIAGTPVAIVSLALMGVAGSLGVMIVVVTIFFVAYFIAYEPYRALYPDLISDDIAARAQSTQAIWRGAGTGAALVGGGLLIAWGVLAPFLGGAILFAVCMVLFLRVAVPRARAAGRKQSRRSGAETVMEEAADLRSILRGHPELRAYLVANALWEASLGALKTFVFLYITVGLGESSAASAGIVGGVALLVLPAAVISGKLADRYGRLRAMAWVLPVYGIGLLVPAFTQSIAVLVPVMLIAGFGGGLVMTLPYALLQPLMPSGRHGALTGFYSLSRGIGTALGPLLAGVAIQALRGPFSATEGYGAMWLVCGGAILLSLPALARLRTLAEDRIDPDAGRSAQLAEG
jgi:MFS family permease